MKRSNLISIVSVLFLVIQVSQIANAQAKYTLQHVTQKNGLPQNSVNSLHFAHSGFLWLTTEAGLIRYDGLNFVSFQMANDSNIQNDRFKWILPYCHLKKVYSMASNGDLFELSDNKIIKTENNLTQSGYIEYIGCIPSINVMRKYISDKQSFAHSPIISVALPNKVMCVLGKSELYFFKNDSIQALISYDGKRMIDLFRIRNHLYAKDRNGQIYFVNTKTLQLQKASIVNEMGKNNQFRCVFKAFSNRTFTFNNSKIFELHITGNPTEIKLTTLLDNLDENLDISDIDVSPDNFFDCSWYQNKRIVFI